MDPITQSVSFLSVYDNYRELVSSGSSSDAAVVADVLVFARRANRWIRRGWEWYFWPELMCVEERYYRATWSGTVDYGALFGQGVVLVYGTSMSDQAYAAGVEVWYDDGEVTGYFSANTGDDTPAINESPASHPEKWTLITDIDAWIPWRMEGESAIGTVKGIYTEDPRQRGNRARRLLWRPERRGITLVGSEVPVSVWVEFRLPCPPFAGPEYASGSTYAAGRTVYYASETPGFEGDFYTAQVAIPLGRSPEVGPLDWEKSQVPSLLADFAARGAYDIALRGDGQGDQANGEEGLAWQWLYDERDKVQNHGAEVRRVRFSR